MMASLKSIWTEVIEQLTSALNGSGTVVCIVYENINGLLS